MKNDFETEDGTFSDINWSTGERPTLALSAGGLGVALGWAGGVLLLLLLLRQPIPPVRLIFPDLFSLLIKNGPILAAPFGWLPIALGVVVGGFFGWGGWVAATRPNARHIKGPRIDTDPRRAARAFMSKGKYPGGVGVPIHPKINISQAAECRHFLILGGPGSGKTTVIWPLLQSAIGRGDRVLVLDFKGDFTAGIPGATLLSPTDDRSARWSLGHDIQTRLDAFALAETLIPLPRGGEPIWTQGARGLLVGLLSHLQTTKPGRWSLADVAALAAKVLVDYKALVKIITKEHPPAKAFLMGADSKTTASFLGQLSGALTHTVELGVADLALRQKKAKAWSAEGWLAGKGPNTAIIGWHASSRELSQAWASAIIEQLVRKIGDMPDCSPSARRVWLVLDEVAQVGKIPSITDALVTLRSKGCRVVLGLQSIAQVSQNYDKETLTVWATATATKIICQSKSRQDQQFAADLVGRRIVERYSSQVTQPLMGASATRSGSWQRAEEPVMPEAAFGHKLGPSTEGVLGVLLPDGSEVVAVLQWPFHQSGDNQVKPKVLGVWVKPGYVRPVWGKVPLAVADVPADAPAGADEGQGGQSGTQKQQNPNQQKEQTKSSSQAETKSEGPQGAGLGTSTQPEKEKPKTEGKGAEEEDPFAELVAGMLLDGVLPGASVVMDVAEKIGGDGVAANAAPLIVTPTINPPAPENGEEKREGDFEM